MTEKGIKQIAEEIAPELAKLIDESMGGDPEERDRLITCLWDNKVGILRVLEVVSQSGYGG